MPTELSAGVGGIVPKSTTVLAPVGDIGEPGTLRDLLATLGPTALRVLHAAGNHLDEPVGEPAVFGPGEPVIGPVEGFVLLTGVGNGSAGPAGRLGEVAAAGGTVAVLKLWSEDPESVRAVAAEVGITALATPDEMAWRHLDALVTAARTVSTAAFDGAGEPRPGDLFALANAIAASLGGPVTIEETSGRVMAYSNLPGQEIDEIRRLAILGRQTPERPTNAEEYQAIVRGPGPVVFESRGPDAAHRIAVAIRAGHQVLGVIFVLGDRPGLVPDADRVLMDAARATALHLLRHRGGHDPQRARRGHALRSLLMGADDPATAAEALDLPATDPVVVACVRPVSDAGRRALEAARVGDLAALHGEYWHPGAASYLDGGSVVVMLPISAEALDAEDRLTSRLRKTGTDLLTAARRSAGVRVAVGFGPVVPGLAAAPASHALAEQTVDVLLSPDSDVIGGSVAVLGDVRAEVFLAAVGRLPALSDDALRLPEVQAVLDHDASQGTDYAETLLTYLGCFGDVAEVARRRSVHENTARYRVKRLTDNFGVDLTAGDRTLVTWLQLRSALRGPGRDRLTSG